MHTVNFFSIQIDCKTRLLLHKLLLLATTLLLSVLFVTHTEPVCASALTSLHSFTADANDGNGGYPQSGLVLDTDGNLYGTTSGMRLGSQGTIFRMRPDGTGYTILHAFGNLSAVFTNTDGGDPGKVALGKNGILYGVCNRGGNNGKGVIFRMNMDGTNFIVLHTFTATDQNFANFDGAQPIGALVQDAYGFLYGTTLHGGLNAVGTLFKVRNDGTGFAVLHTFNPYDDQSFNHDGTEALGLVMSGGGSLYGTTRSGGAYNTGAIFSISTDGTGFNILYSFSALNNNTNIDGAEPSSPPMLGTGGFLYGATASGGINGQGTLYKLTTDGRTFTVIHTFNAYNPRPPINSDGINPVDLIQGQNGIFYGATRLGGMNGNGTLFKISADGSRFDTLYSFNSLDNYANNADGRFPNGNLVLTSAGMLYGSASEGGGDGIGTTFSFNTLSYTHVLWTRVDGTAVIWNLGTDGVAPLHPRCYGPFTDGPGRNWTAQAIADGPDGMTHVLWTRADGMATLWNIVADGVAPLYPKLYGPFTNGPGFNWTAKTISVAPNGTTHVLWTRADGTAVIWNLGTDGVAPLHPRCYGPFTDGPGRNWTAQTIADGPDGMTHVLWTRADGMVTLWDIVADGVAPLYPKLYGPFTDGPGFNWTN